MDALHTPFDAPQSLRINGLDGFWNMARTEGCSYIAVEMDQ